MLRSRRIRKEEKEERISLPSIRLEPGASSARSTRRGVSPSLSLSPPPRSLEKKERKKGCRLRGERNFSGIVNRYLYHRTPTRPRTILERSAYQPGVKTRFNTLAHLPAPFHDKHRKSKAFLSLSSRSSWHPFYARTSPREMASVEDALLPLRWAHRRDGRNNRERSIAIH